MNSDKKEYKLSKIIPSRRKTIRFDWVYKNYMQATEQYLKIRKGLRGRRQSTMISCDWCKHKFEVDEWFGLASPFPNQDGPRRNWALCNTCCDIMGAPDRPKK